MRRKKKTIECIEYLSVSAPLDKVDRLEDKQSKYIHEYVKNKEYMIVGTERRHGFHRMMWTDSGIRLWIRLEKAGRWCNSRKHECYYRQPY